MKKNYLNVFTFLGAMALSCLSFPTFSQITTFQKIYPATVNQSGRDVLPTADGGYLIAGSTETSIVNDVDIMIMKANSAGDLVWTKTYGGNMPEYPNGMIQISAGSYFVIGYTQSAGGGDSDNYILKINTQGDTLWAKSYGGFGNEEAKEIVKAADGNYVFVGASNSVSFSNNNIQLMKIDTFGTVIWNKYYGGPDYESARSVKLCPDGGFIIAGKTAASDTSMATALIIKTNSSGDSLWAKMFTGPDSYEGKSILANADGTYTLALDDSSGVRDSDVRVMKLDASGTAIWNKVYGGTLKDIVKMIQPTMDGGYVLAAISRSFGWVKPDMWMIKLDAAGDSLWTRHYGGPGHEHCFAARQTADSGYIVLGHSKSYSPNTEVMFLKVNQTGDFNPVSVDELAYNGTINIYPNPSVGIVTIDINGINAKNSEFTITDPSGKIVYSGITVSPLTDNHWTIDMKEYSKGIYCVSFRFPDHVVTKKFVLN
jgi:hypothetical protein